MRIWVAVVAVVACSKTEPPTAPPAAPTPKPPATFTEQDAMWALAPAHVELGIVASAEGVAAIERTLGNLRAVAQMPMVQAVLARLGTTDLTLASFGLAADKPAAIFKVGDELVVATVADRERLATRVGRQLPCKTIAGRLVCATSAAVLDTLGKGTIGLAELGERGAIEAALVPPDDELRMLGAAQLAPGTVMVHAAFTHLPPAAIAMFGTPVKPAGDLAHAAGFFAMDVRQMLSGAAPWLADLARTFGGPVTATMPTHPGSLLDLRVPVSDPRAAQHAVDHCADVFGPAGATSANGTCHFPKSAGLVEAVDLWVDNGELRMGTRSASPGPAVPLGPLGVELARTAWAFVVYGHGTLLGTPLHDGQLASSPAVASLAALEEGAIAGRVDGTTLRLVFGARTIWSNPPDIANALAGMLTSPSAGRADEVAALARRSPHSPFAADQPAGAEGLAGAMMFGGIVFAVVLPAMFDRMKKPRQPEAVAALGKLGKAAVAYRTAKGTYPVGKAELTPAAPCCQGPALHCPVVEWNDPTWKALGFAIDKAGLYQYAYRSNGKTFTATAIGDLDCDGISVVYTLSGNADGTTTLTEPTPGSD